MATLGALLQHITQQNQQLQKLLPLSAEQQRAVDKKFRLEFNYNSNHLEGNTLTYGETALLLLFDQTTGDHEMREYEEMKAHDVALKMVQEEALDIERPLTEQFIRSLNKHLLVRDFWKDAQTPDGQSTRKKITPGDYKKTPNSVILPNGEMLHYTEPGKVAAEMAELIQWTNEHMHKEDPVILSSILHYRLVRIHPFDDGNGRVARLLMNYILIRKGYPVVVIKSSEKKQYLAALHKADAGDLPAFSEHIAEQVVWSFDVWLKAAKGESLEEPDDLDKELALLKNELDRRPNNFEKKRSEEELQIIVTERSVQVASAIEEKLEALKDYFVDLTINISAILYSSNNNSGIDYTYNTDKFTAKVNEGLKKYPYLRGLNIGVKGTALKKATERTDIIITNHFTFNEFDYSITINNKKEPTLKKAYGQPFTENEIKHIIGSNLRILIDTIKSATGVSA